ncbi:hypothetical protein [Bradyrhizobium diazoefficiens]|uniref:hypothetical protein n=1 Tax=Bradyrhizobium diazoefficiens TaxID=1355477 RepID=UPI001FEF5F77|nr:hypothetical protein [Bradyrhizobium diazoefficiens]
MSRSDRRPEEISRLLPEVARALLGHHNKDETTRIEVFRLPGTMKRRRKNRGMPPPATFDIDTLPGSSNLTALEVAAVIRRTPGALEQ